MTDAKPKPRTSPWRAFNPGWLAREQIPVRASHQVCPATRRMKRVK